jgi:hypothetical protein
MSSEEQAMNYDLAIDIINLMKMMASRKKANAKSEEERVELDEKIGMYCYEEGVLTGRNGDDLARTSLYDKVFNLYSPIVKSEYAVG